MTLKKIHTHSTTLFLVASTGIEPIPTEPESVILSIELRGLNTDYTAKVIFFYHLSKFSNN